MTIRAPIYTRTDARQRPAELLTWIETLPPGVLSQTIPLRQSDWPNPVRRKTDPEQRTWIETLPPGEISRTLPLRQSDWPNPVRRVSNPALYSVTYSQQIPQPATGRPFVQSDWPNPIRRTHNVELRTFLGELIADYTGTPLVPYDWPNPVRRVWNSSLYSITCSPQITAVVVAGNPFAQTDWPSPQQRKPNPDLRTWVNQTPWPLTVGSPFAQDDWPNPVRKVDSVELRTWVESLNVASIGAPFRQTDWPNPTRRVDSASLRIWINGVQLEQPPQAPLVTGTIPNIFQRQDTGTFQYDLSVYFSGATSYAIAPAIEAGWTFDTGTAVLVIDTDAVAVFGPFTVTATNVTGSTPSNTFTVEVAAIVVDGTVTGGGFWPHLDLQAARRRKRLREIEEAEEDAQRLADDTDREIALLLREQERKDEFRANLERLNALVRQHADVESQAAMSERVQKALARAMAQESVSALIALQRELDRMLEEEEIAVIMLLSDQ